MSWGPDRAPTAQRFPLALGSELLSRPPKHVEPFAAQLVVSW